MTFPPVSYAPLGIDRNSSGVRALGVIGVVFAVTAIVMLPFTLGDYIDYGWPISGGKTAPIEMWNLFSTFVGLGLAILMLLASFGCYRFEEWGRRGMILWSVLSLIYGVAGVYFYGRWLVPWFRGEYARNPAASPFAPLVCWIVGTIMAACTLPYLRRTAIRAVFSRAEE